jgi:hypothetical protein
MVGAAAAEPAAGNAASPLSLGSFVADMAAFVAADLMVETRIAAGAGGHEHVLKRFVDLVAGIAEDLPGFGCAASATKDLAGSSVVEDLADVLAAESVAESLLDTAGFDMVVAALAGAAAPAAAVVAAQVKESLGKQEDRHQH